MSVRSLFGAAVAATLTSSCAKPYLDRPDTPPSDALAWFEVTAHAPGLFTQPRAAVPLPQGGIAFLAIPEPPSDAPPSGQAVAVFTQARGGLPTVLYQGEQLVNPLDIDVSPDGKTLYLADVAGAQGAGALLELPVSGGEPAPLATGYSPRGIAIGEGGAIYFSGVDLDSGEAGVFRAAEGVVSSLYQGPPFVDPGGIAALRSGAILVADTRLFDSNPQKGTAQAVTSEAGVIMATEGRASVVATDFAIGYPAGIALTRDESRLFISGEKPDRSDTVYVLDLASPKTRRTMLTDVFSEYQDSSGGLKRAHDDDTFVWASLSANGGTIYTVHAE